MRSFNSHPTTQIVNNMYSKRESNSLILSKLHTLNRTKKIACIFVSRIYIYGLLIPSWPGHIQAFKVLFSDFFKTWLRPSYLLTFKSR